MTNGKVRNQLIGLVVAGALAAAASAGPSTLKFTDTDAWGQEAAGDLRGGGPYEVRPVGFLQPIEGLGAHGAAAGAYLSFCVELNESIGLGTFDAVMNTEAISGGLGGGNPDPLDAQTAFLYTAFLQGTLDSKLVDAGLLAFTYGDGTSGTALQEAIWVLEEEIGAGGVTSALATDLLTLAADAVDAGGEWFGKGIGDVRILNLTDAAGNLIQDQLVLIPLPIPVLLGLAGLAGVGLFSRRRRLLG